MNKTIRVLVDWGHGDTPGGSNPELWIEPMPFVPRVGDLFSLDDMIDESDSRIQSFDERQAQEFFGLSYSVRSVVWKKDKQGYFIKLLLIGE